MQTWEPEMQTARFQTKRLSCLHWLHWGKKNPKKQNPEKTKHKKSQKHPQKHRTISQWKFTEDKETFPDRRGERGVKCKTKLFYNLRLNWKKNFITSTNLSFSQKSQSQSRAARTWVARVPSAQQNTDYASTSHRARRIQVPHKWHQRGSLSRNATASDNSLPRGHRSCSGRAPAVPSGGSDQAAETTSHMCGPWLSLTRLIPTGRKTSAPQNFTWYQRGRLVGNSCSRAPIATGLECSLGEPHCHGH